MSYAEVSQVQDAFDRAVWDATKHSPTAAEVTAWLASESLTLDGQLDTLVATPVDPTDSPKLHAVCARIVTLRAQASVQERKSTDSAMLDKAKSWRREAQLLVDGIAGGRIADGTPRGGAGADHTGAPVGRFGDDYAPTSMTGRY